MENTNNNRIYGLVGTLLFHGIAFLIFFLIIFKTPIPPFPEEGGGGYEVSFGNSEEGSGDVQPTEESGNNADVTETKDPVSSTKVTQNVNEAPAEKVLTHEAGEETVQMNDGKNETKPSEKSTNVEATKPVVEERKADSKFAYKKRKGNAVIANEGDGSGKGDQGVENGSMNSRYHGPGGNGVGGQGEGAGSGLGLGSGPGNGFNKSAISFNLLGRRKQKLPIPKANFNEEGRVVVEIKVDQNGVVVMAKPGAKGSTTANPQLLDIAKNAAMSATFNVDNDAPDVQIGQITYNFYLK